MNITDAIRDKKAKQTSKPKTDGINEAVLISSLTRAGCDQITIDDCLEEPQEIWPYLIYYFESKSHE